MVERPWSFSRLSCGEGLLLRCDWNAGNALQTTQVKDPSSRAMRWKRCSSESGPEDLDTLEWSGYVGELLELQQGCEGPLEVPEDRCD